jgi:ribosomal protein L7/L12
MALSNEDLLKELSAKPIMEVVELVKMLEDEWEDRIRRGNDQLRR